MDSKSILFVSFATKGSPYYRDYSQRIEYVRHVMKSLEAEFLIFDQDSLRDLNISKMEMLYLSCRRGVGYWFWKPVILLYLVERFPKRLIVYFDIDVDILSLPRRRVIDLVRNSESGFGAYLTNSRLIDWTKRSMVRKFELEEDSKIFEASVLIVDASHKAIIDTLNAWRSEMQDPSKLLDDLFDFDGRHRHDQTILSVSESIGKFRIQDIGTDFWIKPEGILNSKRKFGQFFRDCRSVVFHKFQLFLFIIRHRFHLFNKEQYF